MPHADLEKRKEYQRSYQERRRSDLLDYGKSYRARLSPEKREANRARRRELYAKNKETILPKERDRVQRIDPAIKAAAKRLRRYGISQAQYDELLAKQNFVCAVCGVKPPVDVDHCHDTGVVRGLLCRGCNVGLGQLGDSIEGLMKGIEYLRKGMN